MLMPDIDKLAEQPVTLNAAAAEQWERFQQDGTLGPDLLEAWRAAAPPGTTYWGHTRGGYRFYLPNGNLTTETETP